MSSKEFGTVNVRRGDRTLASVLGVARSLDAAIGAVMIAFLLFGVAAVRAGWRLPGDAWRWTALVVAALAWGLVLAPWRFGIARLTPADHQRGMYRALAAWAVTDAVVVYGWGW